MGNMYVSRLHFNPVGMYDDGDGMSTYPYYGDGIGCGEILYWGKGEGNGRGNGFSDEYGFLSGDGKGLGVGNY